MGKQIRPIYILKKVNPIFFDICFNDKRFSTPKTSKKNRENIGYWKYAWFNLSNETTDFIRPNFFFDTNWSRNNICTLTEIGRLLLSGYCYGNEVESFCQQIAQIIYKPYNRKRAQNDKFNDLEFSEALKEIRKNLIYYFHNPNEAKYYIIEKLFKTYLRKLLPPQPEALTQIEKRIEAAKNEKKRNERTDKDFYFFRAKFIERYSEYLQRELTKSGCQFLSETDFKEIENRYWDKELERINRIETDYKKQVIKEINLNQLVESNL